MSDDHEAPPHTEVEVARMMPPCDFDAAHGDAAVDAKTSWGPWAYMCEECFTSRGVGLGLGWGQRLIRRKEK